MKKTIMRDFLKILKSLDMYKDENWNKTETVYKFSKGWNIEFVGLNKAEVGKGKRSNVEDFNENNRGGIQYQTVTMN